MDKKVSHQPHEEERKQDGVGVNTSPVSVTLYVLKRKNKTATKKKKMWQILKC